MFVCKTIKCFSALKRCHEKGRVGKTYSPLISETKHMTKPSRWYCEYNSHIRIYDYFNLMVFSFPLLTWRRYDYVFKHRTISIHCVALLGVTLNKN